MKQDLIVVFKLYGYKRHTFYIGHILRTVIVFNNYLKDV